MSTIFSQEQTDSRIQMCVPVGCSFSLYFLPSPPDLDYSLYFYSADLSCSTCPGECCEEFILPWPRPGSKQKHSGAFHRPPTSVEIIALELNVNPKMAICTLAV